jgi:HlyD family secretion protein
VARISRNPRWLVGLALVGGLLAVALWPPTVPVELATVARGPLVVTVNEEAETRIRHRFVVSAPVTGRVLRIELEAGDPVTRGQVVARMLPEPPPLLDARTRAEARAAIDTARATLGRARAEEQRLRKALALAEQELARTRELHGSGLATRQQLDARDTDARAAQDAAEAASFAARAAEADLRRAEARLAPSPPAASGRVVDIAAPVDGVVLRRVRESEAVVPAGEPLLELGDPARIEIVSDLLSTDAVKVRPGARAIVDQWGGDRPLDARVRRVEPSGFTKVSALGVEEQRVNVVLDFADPSAAVAALGDAYRVEVAIVVWERDEVLKVPTGALFRRGEQWAAYVADAGRARERTVTVGQRTAREAEVLGGLAAGDQVVLHPGDTLADGVRVRSSR